MVKILVVIAALGAGFAVFRKRQQARADQDLWAEAVDPVR